MTQYRFVTPHRTGKWYPDLLTAQHQAFAIGAGFFDQRSATFYPYKDTLLEVDGANVFGPPHGIAA